jgi:hypothetical protein
MIRNCLVETLGLVIAVMALLAAIVLHLVLKPMPLILAILRLERTFLKNL